MGDFNDLSKNGLNPNLGKLDDNLLEKIVGGININPKGKNCSTWKCVECGSKGGVGRTHKVDCRYNNLCKSCSTCSYNQNGTCVRGIM